jgi:hypothetical protein
MYSFFARFRQQFVTCIPLLAEFSRLESLTTTLYYTISDLESANNTNSEYPLLAAVRCSSRAKKLWSE